MLRLLLPLSLYQMDGTNISNVNGKDGNGMELGYTYLARLRDIQQPVTPVRALADDNVRCIYVPAVGSGCIVSSRNTRACLICET